MKYLTLWFALVLGITPAVAIAIDGNDFVSYAKEWKKDFDGHKTTDAPKVRGFQLYVLGVSDSLEGALFCSPSNVTGKQLFSIVVKYIEDHPENWSNSSFNLVYSALSETFPCKKK